VEIAKVLAREPSVVIFDEATSALSREEVDWLLWLMRQMANDKKIVLFISHRLGEVRQVADRFTVYRNGRNVGSRLPQEANSDELVALMLGRKAERLFPVSTRQPRKEAVLETEGLQVGHRAVASICRYSRAKFSVWAVSPGRARMNCSCLYWYSPTARHDPRTRQTGDHSQPARRTERRHRAGARSRRPRKPGPDSADDAAGKHLLTILSSLARFGFVNRGREATVARSMIDQLRIVSRGVDQPVARLSAGISRKLC